MNNVKNISGIIIMLTVFIFNACGETEKGEETATDEIVISMHSDKEGKVLNLEFNNTKSTVIFKLNGETAELEAERSGSGIWYRNDEYELRGKGNDLQLTKNGKIIFEHQDDIKYVEANNENNNVLNMTFNNSEGTVKAYLSGGEQIDLKEVRSASGIWYKNDEYELRGKGENYELTKNDKVIFKSII